MRLSASRLSVERGGRIVFADLSFAIESGESLVVTGRNGAGKSTLLRALAGLLPLAAGEISCAPAGEETVPEMAHYLGHADALKGALTVTENLDFFAAILGSGRGGLPAQEALAAFGLAHVAALPAAYLSAGQKRRAALAKLLVASRPVWLLDEPSTALDADSQIVMAKIMAAHLAGGGMIVAATHIRLDLAGRELRLGRA
ncbi:heme ABC exporter ATP-binding protein CcmA [Methylocapsa aurea]|uniref:heme ABC exporter ATP-binding protein CcmA n=1 Tax=Methylocapsa aurea TaxID=663610 RepID=UPI0005647E37|nr:heme ABC exporter ATP-binding protein CcmA [Methylocapsa aurea]